MATAARVLSRLPHLIRSAALLILALLAKDSHAQPRDSELHRIYLHLETGPGVSLFRDHLIRPEASPVAIGGSATFRAMWRTDHHLAFGLRTGYQLIIQERYWLTDDIGSSEVTASLAAIPIVACITMHEPHIEVGVGLGGFLMQSYLRDLTEARSSRFELGASFYGSYTWPLTANVSIGPELAVTYLSYRGIVAVSPRVNLAYELFSY